MPRGKQKKAVTSGDPKVVKTTKAARKGSAARDKSKKSSIFDSIMRDQYDDISTTASIPLRDDVRSVMNRPTARTLHWRKINQQSMPATPNALPGNSQDQPKDANDGKLFQDILAMPIATGTLFRGRSRDVINIFNRKLPRDIRLRIYQLVAVYDKHFIYPSSSNGCEQPDLAMTCRSIREEVLEVYYSENAFAVELARFRGGSRAAAPRQGSASPVKWLHMLAKTGRLPLIQHWVFVDEVELMPETPQLGAIRKRSVLEFVIISLTFQRAVSGDDQDESTSIRLEVHNDAGCVLPVGGNSSSNNKCNVQVCPSWFNDTVIQATTHGTNVSFDVDRMVLMLKTFAKESAKIVHMRCNKTHSA